MCIHQAMTQPAFHKQKGLCGFALACWDGLQWSKWQLQSLKVQNSKRHMCHQGYNQYTCHQKVINITTFICCEYRQNSSTNLLNTSVTELDQVSGLGGFAGCFSSSIKDSEGITHSFRKRGDSVRGVFEAGGNGCPLGGA